MLRAINLLAMTAGFLMLSPSLRENVADAGVQSFAYLNAHSPFSYIAAAVIALALMGLMARSVYAPH